MTWAETYCSKQVCVASFDATMIDIMDVAHSLSLQCRYNGHTTVFYSVAEHSCHISEWVLRRTGNAKHALSALLHDASEAYLCDVPAPVKALLSNYKEIEERVERVIASAFGLDYPWSALIKEADLRILNDERKALFRDSGFVWESSAVEPLGAKIEALQPADAKQRFLANFNNLHWRSDL